MTIIRSLIAAAALVVLVFGGNVFAMKAGSSSPDEVRSASAKSLMAALERYRSAKGSYPILSGPDNDVADLDAPLVGGKFISAIPLTPGKGIRYVSTDGKAYGLLIVFDKQGRCRVEVGANNTLWWGNTTPPCAL